MLASEMRVKVGLLETVDISLEKNPSNSIQQAVELASIAENLGFERIWYAEHHSHGQVAGVAPELFLVAAAQSTSRIKVGTGGILFAYHSPLKIAEWSYVLTNLYGNRVELGLARAIGASAAYANLLNPCYSDNLKAFEDRVLELRSLIRGERKGFEHIKSNMSSGIWILGASIKSATFAGSNGISYCYGSFIEPVRLSEAINAFNILNNPGEFAVSCVALAIKIIKPEIAPSPAIGTWFSLNENEHVLVCSPKNIYLTVKKVITGLLKMGVSNLIIRLDINDWELKLDILNILGSFNTKEEILL